MSDLLSFSTQWELQVLNCDCDHVIRCHVELTCPLYLCEVFFCVLCRYARFWKNRCLWWETFSVLSPRSLVYSLNIVLYNVHVSCFYICLLFCVFSLLTVPKPPPESSSSSRVSSEIVHQRHCEKALSCTHLPKLSFKCGCGIKDRCIVSGINCLLAIWHWCSTIIYSLSLIFS